MADVIAVYACAGFGSAIFRFQSCRRRQCCMEEWKSRNTMCVIHGFIEVFVSENIHRDFSHTTVTSSYDKGEKEIERDGNLREPDLLEANIVPLFRGHVGIATENTPRKWKRKRQIEEGVSEFLLDRIV